MISTTVTLVIAIGALARFPSCSFAGLAPDRDCGVKMTVITQARRVPILVRTTGQPYHSLVLGTDSGISAGPRATRKVGRQGDGAAPFSSNGRIAEDGGNALKEMLDLMRASYDGAHVRSANAGRSGTSGAWLTSL